jgi:hypothetical protein
MRSFGNLPALHLENSIPLPYSIGSLANFPMHTRSQKYQANDNLARQIVGKAIDKKAIRVYFISAEEGKEFPTVDPRFQNHQKNSIFHSQSKGIKVYKLEIAA